MNTQDLADSAVRIPLDQDGNLLIAPEKWTRIGFWEEFFDGNAQAMNDFEEQKNTILAQAFSDA